MPTTPSPAQRGFTLLEVLVALAILGVAVVTLIELSSRSLRLVKTSGDYQRAVQLADRLAAETKATDEAVDSGADGPFQWERKIALVAVPDELQPKETVPGKAPASLFAVTIDVRWGQSQQLELATLRTPFTIQTPSPTPGSSSIGQLTPSAQSPSTQSAGSGAGHQ